MNSCQQCLKRASFRWSGSFLFVVAVYAGIVLTVLSKCASEAVVSEHPVAAIVVEFALLPVVPATQLNALPVAPKKVEIPPPEPVVESKIEPEVAELPVIKQAVAVLRPKPEPVKEKPLEPKEERVEQQKSAPPAVEAPPSNVAATPMEKTVLLAAAQEKATWQSTLLSHLEKHKRYPRQARRRKQEGTVYVRITMNSEGAVLNHHLTAASPYPALNREALALIIRAQPLPVPLFEVAGDTVDFVVPVTFTLHH